MAKIIRKNWKLILVVKIALGTLAGGIFAFYIGFNIYKGDIDKVVYYTPKLTTQIYDAHGELIANLFDGEHRTYVHFDDIPPRVIEAIVAIEDTSFFEHPGVNFEAIFRAAYKVIVARKAVEGASTITQQVVKNLLLTREKTITRKAKEAILALKIERVLTKEQILERYLNEIYFGHGYYGIKTAAKGYFRKELKDLTLKEVGILVGLPRAPSFYDPTKHKLHSSARANLVVGRMYKLGWINQSEYEEAINEDPVVYSDSRTLNKAPYIVDYVTAQMTPEYPDFKSGGYIVNTTIDLKAQELAREAMTYGYEKTYKRIKRFIAKEDNKKYEEYLIKLGEYNALVEDTKFKIRETLAGEDNISVNGVLLSSLNIKEDSNFTKIFEVDLNITKPQEYVQIDENQTLNRLDSFNGALVSMKQESGEIVAMVGGVDYKKSNFNRAVQTKRQVGSSFKPFLYMSSFDLGYAPSSLIPDISRTYKFQIDENTERVWKPSNYENNFVGLMTEREAMIHSRNLATINLVTGVGLKPILEKLDDYGFEGLPRDLSISLGSYSLPPITLSKHYTAISNYGVMVEPRIVNSITDRFLQVKEFEPVKTRVTTEGQSYLMVDVLRDVVRRGTGRRARVKGSEAAGKTGTTNDYRDAWFCGFTPSLQTIVWFGNDNYLPIADKESGGKVAGPVFQKFNNEYLKVHPEFKRKFERPDSVYEVRLPNGKKEIFTDISKPPKRKAVQNEKQDLLF
ncbi:MAG: PBP1A family penicillin-binding protein [Campylobacterales bacterium]|nr:PBP1A family penicillin-binding protein [Campylobacterales bacterium]